MTFESCMRSITWSGKWPGHEAIGIRHLFRKEEAAASSASILGTPTWGAINIITHARERNFLWSHPVFIEATPIWHYFVLDIAARPKSTGLISGLCKAIETNDKSTRTDFVATYSWNFMRYLIVRPSTAWWLWLRGYPPSKLIRGGHVPPVPPGSYAYGRFETAPRGNFNHPKHVPDCNYTHQLMNIQSRLLENANLVRLAKKTGLECWTLQGETACF